LFVGNWVGLMVVPIVLVLWRRAVVGARLAGALDDRRFIEKDKESQ
jgi:hypothetical protein